MKKILSFTVSAAAAALVTGCSSVCPFAADKETTYVKEIVGVKPTLFADLGVTFPVPDGLAINPVTNNLVLAVPNYRDFEKHGAKMVTLNKKGEVIDVFKGLPLEPTTKSVHPMGIGFGPDGNLYIADNQCFGGLSGKWQSDKSRILRLNYKNGKPTTCDVVVTGLGVSNAIRWEGNNLYLTDSILHHKGTNGDMSGVYRFSLDEVKQGNKPFAVDHDKHLIVESKGEEKGFGADGMDFDAEGNMYYGHFSGGMFYKVTFNEDGSVKCKKLIMNSPAFECCDGIIVDKEKNLIYITNSAMNSIWIYDITANTMQRLWENADSDGKDGSIDQPCEPILWDGDLYVVNFDWTFPHLRNRVSDDVNTISKFDLKNCNKKKLCKK